MKEMLTKAECSAMRGIAILAIMLHNFCHFNGKIVQENEYQFIDFNNDRLWQVLSNPTELLPVHLLSYFGHYGVPVFLFLSGFGLVRKYETSPSLPKGFILYHYLNDLPDGRRCDPRTLCLPLGKRAGPAAHVYQCAASA